MPTVNFTATQAAQQIDRAALAQVPGWVPALGAPVTLSYAYRASAQQSDFGLPAEMGGFMRFTSSQIAAGELAMALWSDVANIRLTRVGTGASGDGAYSNSADFLLGNWTTGVASSYLSGYGTFAWESSGGATARASRVWIDGTRPANLDPLPTNSGLELFIHEIGHGIGLSHPGTYDAGPGRTLTYAANAEYVQDTQQYTIMSYFSESNTGADYGGRLPTTPMLHDIAAVQLMYGANTATRAGNTTYGFNSNADRAVFALSSAADRPVFTIWDSGGTNTLDLSGFSANQTISLLPGSFSDVNGLRGNIAIAFGTTIHNARGGSGRDTITGNDADNAITGGVGNDTLDGRGGSNVSLYSGAAKNYAVTLTAGSPTITVQDKTGADGTDSLTNIQRVQFTDQTIDTTWFGKTASLSSAELTSLTQLYIASFNRAPDALGLNYWGSQFKDGMSLGAIAGSFFVQPEAAAAYPAGQPTETFVNAVYNNVLGRSADAAGLGYWSGQLANGGVGKNTFLLALINGAIGPDLANLANKVTVGSHFALSQGLSDAAWAKTVMAGVNGTAASVTAANAQTDGFAATAATVGGAELVVKILGIVA